MGVQGAGDVLLGTSLGGHPWRAARESKVTWGWRAEKGGCRLRPGAPGFQGGREDRPEATCSKKKGWSPVCSVAHDQRHTENRPLGDKSSSSDVVTMKTGRLRRRGDNAQRKAFHEPF